jgi:hypothetical protein
VVPLHLVDLYNQATADRTEQGQEDIANLLAKYSQAFPSVVPFLEILLMFPVLVCHDTGFACDNFIVRTLL